MNLFDQRLLAMVVGAILCVAALGKIRSLLDPVTVASESGYAALGNFGLSMCEVLLAWWMVSGWKTWHALRVSQIVFLSFALFSGFKWLNGEIDCGCFGPELKIHPAFVVFFDSALVLLLEVTIRVNKLDGESEITSSSFDLAILKSNPTSVRSRLRFRFNQTNDRFIAALLLTLSGLLLWIGRSQIPIVRSVNGDWNQEWEKSDAIAVLALRLNPGRPLILTWAPPSQKKILMDHEVTCLLVNANCEHCRNLVAQLAECKPRSSKPWVIVEFNRQIVESSEEIHTRFDEALAQIEIHNPGVRRLRIGKPFYLQTAAPALLQLRKGNIESVTTNPEDIAVSLMKEMNHVHQ